MPTRQTHVRMAEASFLSRKDDTNNYTRVANHAHPMRAIHSHRAHSATSQGVYLSGRRTPGGTSRARRLLATNTALLTSAHRMISPPSHKRQPCTLPTHPHLHNPTKPKTAASKQKGTHTTRSLALPKHTKPSLSSLSSPPPRPLADFLSLAPLRPTPPGEAR